MYNRLQQLNKENFKMKNVVKTIMKTTKAVANNNIATKHGRVLTDEEDYGF